jgi:hypothetical protein
MTQNNSTRVLTYLYQYGSKLIYVSTDKNSDHPLESFRMFIGKANGKPMKEILIDAVSRRRDGGTTYIHTNQGRLYSPTPIKKEEFPTWRHNLLHAVIPSQYNICENDGDVTISPS